MSAKTNWPSEMMPPPPMPWMTLPMSRTVKLLARAQIMLPAVKDRRHGTRSSRRPKMSERAAINGCTTAETRRYEVPAQKASEAVPLSVEAKV